MQEEIMKDPKGFKPTYEELKQDSKQQDSSWNFCFKPTYEELKPSIVIISLS